MGFDKNGIKLLLGAKKDGIVFNKTVTLGRQYLYLTKEQFKQALEDNNVYEELEVINNLFNGNDGYSEIFLKYIGVETLDVVDVSDYEGANVIHDMNLPILESFKNKYDVLIDGGTLEHIFNFPVAIKNCMELIKEGGTYIGITPANNYFGHGFYQFSPELYYRVFSKENGFKIEKCIVYTDTNKTSFYEVVDPDSVKDRVTLQNKFPTYLFIIAKKISKKVIFNIIPQQSDYQSLYNAEKKKHEQVKLNYKGKILEFLLIPFYFIRLQMFFIKRKLRLFKKDLGIINEKYFKKIK